MSSEYTEQVPTVAWITMTTQNRQAEVGSKSGGHKFGDGIHTDAVIVFTVLYHFLLYSWKESMMPSVA